MCRNINCFMAMAGHGHAIHSMAELMALLGRMTQQGQSNPDQTHDQFIASSIENLDAEMRGLEMARKVLTSDPPREGAELVALETGIPIDPKKHGVSTVASYALEDGSFLVIGVDYLTQTTIEHTTPNQRGLGGLIEATREELAKKAVAAADAAEATDKAAQPDPVV